MMNVEHVRTLQSVVRKSVGSCFSDLELDHLGVLIRLTVEFHDYIQGPSKNPLEPRYTCESIFAGIESFTTVTRAYKSLAGAMNSSLEGSISPATLKETFVSMFSDFLVEENFEKRCRLLLDLFKIQIVYAGMRYE